MRHKISRHRLNRFTSWREATLKSLARALLTRQRIRTTLAKAKAMRPLAEKLLLLAKQNSIAARREAFRILNDHALVSRLFKEIGPRFDKRPSGFTRIIRLGQRRGDNAQIAILELTEIKEKAIKKPKKEKEKEVKPAEEKIERPVPQKPVEEKKPEAPAVVKEKPPISKKPTKKFLGGLRNIFKKERDSL